MAGKVLRLHTIVTPRPDWQPPPHHANEVHRHLAQTFTLQLRSKTVNEIKPQLQNSRTRLLETALQHLQRSRSKKIHHQLKVTHRRNPLQETVNIYSWGSLLSPNRIGSFVLQVQQLQGNRLKDKAHVNCLSHPPLQQPQKEPPNHQSQRTQIRGYHRLNTGWLNRTNRVKWRQVRKSITLTRYRVCKNLLLSTTNHHQSPRLNQTRIRLLLQLLIPPNCNHPRLLSQVWKLWRCLPLYMQICSFLLLLLPEQSQITRQIVPKNQKIGNTNC